MVLVMDEPLGVVPPIIEVTSLKNWGDITPLHIPTKYNISPGYEASPFPLNPTINRKIYFWYVH
jgi:hypothetical protein